VVAEAPGPGDEAGHECADSRTGFEECSATWPPPGVVASRARGVHVSSCG